MFYWLALLSFLGSGLSAIVCHFVPWQLYCLSVSELRLLSIPLVSSNFYLKLLLPPEKKKKKTFHDDEVHSVTSGR